MTCKTISEAHGDYKLYHEVVDEQVGFTSEGLTEVVDPSVKGFAREAVWKSAVGSSFLVNYLTVITVGLQRLLKSVLTSGIELADPVRRLLDNVGAWLMATTEARNEF